MFGRRLLCVTIALFSLSLQAGSSADWQNRVQSALQDNISKGQHLSIASGFYDHGAITQRLFVNERQSKHAAMDDRFEIGSITKVYLALLIHQSVAQGSLKLDDRVSDHIKELSGKRAGSVTLRQLLTHTAGYPADFDTVVKKELRSLEGIEYADVIAALADDTLIHESGQFAYSNLGYALLSYIIEMQQKKDFASLVRERIFEPLQMIRSEVGGRGPLVQGYRMDYEAVGPTLFGKMTGVGGIRSNVEDQLKFLAAVAEGDQRISASGFDESLIDLKDFKVGYAWGILETADYKLLSHEGRSNGFSGIIAWDSKRKRGFVALSDTASRVACTVGAYIETPCDVDPPSLLVRLSQYWKVWTKAI